MATVQAALGATTAALGLAVLSGRVRPGSSLIAAGPVCGGVAALGLIGFGGIAAAGYVMAVAVPVLLVAIALLAARSAVSRIVVVVAAIAAGVFAILGPIPFTSFYGMFADALSAAAAPTLAAMLFVAFSGIWLLWGALLGRGPARLGAFALRHRVGITVLAACCALPYAVARISWLTPWPLFGGEAVGQGGPIVLATGLMLGAAMLAGGLLTLGLVLPWGSLFPRWLPRIGGRPVPVGLAVAPASIVAVLFTAAGVEMLRMAFAPENGLPVMRLALPLVLPFWLWGPLLALATWGYAQYRAASGGRALS
jgi:hypothetical protein